MSGKRIKLARLQAGLTQQELADMADLPQGHISKLERDKLNTKRIRVDTLRRLCDVLHVTPNDLMEYEAN
jgi:transcriptional regulator with XRE-family HTH domain